MTDTEIYEYACGWRPYLRKQVGMQDSEDLLHEWFIALAGAEHAERIQGPFPNYAWGTLHNLMYQRWTENRFVRNKVGRLDEAIAVETHLADPEQRMLAQEREDFGAGTFRGLKPRQREVLTRFYLNDEPRESIEKGMGLTTTQFRLLKTRAKAAYGAKGKARMVICN